MRKLKLALARTGTKLLPGRLVHWYRRRRALRRYLSAVAYEVYHRQVRIENTEELEGRIAARRDGFYDRLVKEVVDRTELAHRAILDRTELLLQELDRRIEGASARNARDVRELREELGEIRAGLHQPRLEGDWQRTTDRGEATDVEQRAHARTGARSGEAGG